jgi:hypothetical protein
LLVVFKGATVLPQLVIDNAQSTQGIGLALSVADLACNWQLPLVELEGAAVLAQVVVGSAHVAKSDAFAAPVTNLVCDPEVLLVILDGAAVLAQGEVGNTEVVEMGALHPSVLQASGSGESGGSPSDGFAWMLAQTETVETLIGIVRAQLARFRHIIRVICRPHLSRLKVPPFKIKQPQPLFTVFASALV